MLTAKVNEIQKRRTAANLSREALSRKAGLPDNAIYRIEKCMSAQTHPLRARAIAKALKCKVTDIFDEPDKQRGA